MSCRASPPTAGRECHQGPGPYSHTPGPPPRTAPLVLSSLKCKCRSLLTSSYRGRTVRGARTPGSGCPSWTSLCPSLLLPPHGAGDWVSGRLVWVWRE